MFIRVSKYHFDEIKKHLHKEWSVQLEKRRIGEGSQSSVWAGQCTVGECAIKLSPFRGELPNRLRDELDISRKLIGSTKIVTLLGHASVRLTTPDQEASDPNGCDQCLVTWWVRYEKSLDRELDSHPSGIGRKKVQTWMTSILEALSQIHGREVIHRDVKPDNMMLTDFGQALLGDFGVSILQRSATDRRTAFAGTPGFISAKHESKAGDLVSLLISYVALRVGRYPSGEEFDRDDSTKILDRFEPHLLDRLDPDEREFVQEFQKDWRSLDHIKIYEIMTRFLRGGSVSPLDSEFRFDQSSDGFDAQTLDEVLGFFEKLGTNGLGQAVKILPAHLEIGEIADYCQRPRVSRQTSDDSNFDGFEDLPDFELFDNTLIKNKGIHLLVGDPGMGKSTSLWLAVQRLCTEFAGSPNEPHCIPLVLPSGGIAARLDERTLVAIAIESTLRIAYSQHEAVPPSVRTFIEMKVARNEFSLFLDGIDRAPISVHAWLNVELARLQQVVPILVTSINASAVRDICGVLRSRIWRLSLFDWTQILRFIDRYFENADQQLAESAKLLTQNNEGRRFISLPKSLAIFCSLVDKTHEVPSKPNELIRLVLRALIRRGDEEVRQTHFQEDRAICKERSLRHVAFRLVERSDTESFPPWSRAPVEFSHQDFSEIHSRIAKENCQIIPSYRNENELFEELKEDGLIVECDAGYRLASVGLQDYLVAAWVVHESGRLASESDFVNFVTGELAVTRNGASQNAIGLSSWEKIWVHVVAELGANADWLLTPVVRQVRKEKDQKKLRFYSSEWISKMACQAPADCEFRTYTRDLLLQWLEVERRFNFRRIGDAPKIICLARISNDEVRAKIKEWLEDRSLSMDDRTDCVQAAKIANLPSVTKTLCRILAESGESDELRIACVEALFPYSDAVSCRYMWQILRDENESVRIRKACVRGIKWKQDRRTVVSLEELVRAKSFNDVLRLECLDCLLTLSNKSYLDICAERLADNAESLEFRIDMLKRLAFLDAIDSEVLENQLAQASSPLEIRYEIVSALAKNKKHESLKLLAIDRSSDTQLRLHCLNELKVCDSVPDSMASCILDRAEASEIRSWAVQELPDHLQDIGSLCEVLSNSEECNQLRAAVASTLGSASSSRQISVTLRVAMESFVKTGLEPVEPSKTRCHSSLRSLLDRLNAPVYNANMLLLGETFPKVKPRISGLILTGALLDLSAPETLRLASIEALAHIGNEFSEAILRQISEPDSLIVEQLEIEDSTFAKTFRAYVDYLTKYKCNNELFPGAIRDACRGAVADLPSDRRSMGEDDVAEALMWSRKLDWNRPFSASAADDGRRSLARACVTAMAALNDGALSDYLLDLCRSKSTCTEIRKLCINALNNRQSFSTLVSVAEDTEQLLEIRIACLHALGKRPPFEDEDWGVPTDQEESLVRICEESNDEAFQVACVAAIWNSTEPLNVPRCLDRMLGWVCDIERSASARKSMISAFDDVTPRLGTGIRDELIRLTEDCDEDVEVRCACVHKLTKACFFESQFPDLPFGDLNVEEMGGELGWVIGKPTTSLLVSVLSEKTNDTRLRIACIAGLALSSHHAEIASILNGNDEELIMREAAAIGMAIMGDIKELTRILGDDEAPVGLRAACAFGVGRIEQTVCPDDM